MPHTVAHLRRMPAARNRFMAGGCAKPPVRRRTSCKRVVAKGSCCHFGAIAQSSHLLHISGWARVAMLRSRRLSRRIHVYSCALRGPGIRPAVLVVDQLGRLRARAGVYPGPCGCPWARQLGVRIHAAAQLRPGLLACTASVCQCVYMSMCPSARRLASSCMLLARGIKRAMWDLANSAHKIPWCMNRFRVGSSCVHAQTGLNILHHKAWLHVSYLHSEECSRRRIDRYRLPTIFSTPQRLGPCPVLRSCAPSV